MAPRAASWARAGKADTQKRRQNRRLRLNTPKDPYCHRFVSNKGIKGGAMGRQGKGSDRRNQSTLLSRKGKEDSVEGRGIRGKYS